MDKATLKRWLIGDFTWVRLLRSGLLIYVFFAAYVFFRADSMIFLPPAASYGESDEVLRIPVTEEAAIAALHLPNEDARYTVLFIHGNAEDLGDIRPFLETLHQWGFSVFAYDYRGYGLSDGRPSERNAYQDVEAAYRYLTTQLQVSPDTVLLYGRSVGGGSATYLAARHPVGGLILESTFTSVFRVVVPIPLLPFDKFPNRRRMDEIAVPVLVMHGQADQTIPFHHGQRLYEAASAPKLSLWIPTADHNDFAAVAGDRLRIALLEFQDQVTANGRSQR